LISHIAALSTNRVIGVDGDLPWKISADLKHFKSLTLNKCVIMGRKTFESIVAMLGKPLPGRKNIVVTRNPEFHYDGVIVASSLEDALEKARALAPTEIHIGGGADLYRQALPYVDELYLTLVDDEPEADTFFPEYETLFTVTQEHGMQTHDGLSYQWVDYKRN
jgi:dihydrofolate reductase